MKYNPFNLLFILSYNLLLFILISCSAIKNTSETQLAFVKCPLHYHDSTARCIIGNNYGQIQTFGSDTDIYLHPGIDILGKPDQKVYSVSDGIVKAILTPEKFKDWPDMWRIAISKGIDTTNTKGFLYAHIRKESIPFKVGDTVKAGQTIGTLYKWFDEKYTHVHFTEIIDKSKKWNGQWHTIRTVSLEQHGNSDTSRPVFENTRSNQLFAFKNKSGTFLNPDSLSGEVQVIFKAYDYSNSNYKLGISEIEYEFIPYEKRPKEINNVKYNLNLPLDFYALNKTSAIQAKTLYCLDDPCQSVHNYTDRNFYYYLINKEKTDSITYTYDDTFINLSNIPSGTYTLRITIEDYYKNKSNTQMKVTINKNN